MNGLLKSLGVLFFLMNSFGFQARAAHEVTLALDWKPEPEFGGFYEASLQHAYDQLGISVSILPGGAGQPVTQMVAGKKVKFGIAAANDVILARSQGAKVVALYAVYQNDPQGIMVHPERGFKSLKEVFQSSGTLALQKGLPYTLWLEKKFAPIKATVVPYTGGIASFLQDPQFSQQCFIFSEPLAAEREKMKSKTFLISESGFNPYLTVVIAHEDTVVAEPELVQKFLQGTQKGWTQYLKNPSKTNVEMQKINSSMDLATFNQAAQAQRSFIETPWTQKNGLGSMDLERWTTLYSQLVELKLVKPGMDPKSFFKKSEK